MEKTGKIIGYHSFNRKEKIAERSGDNQVKNHHESKGSAINVEKIITTIFDDSQGVTLRHRLIIFIDIIFNIVNNFINRRRQPLIGNIIEFFA